MADLAELWRAGWDIDLAAHVRRGGHVLGVCGGYQMLGRRIADPDGVEGSPGDAAGLGLLDVETVLTGDKVLRAVSGRSWTGVPVTGYEMHVGRTTGPGCRTPMLHFADGRTDGAVSGQGSVLGCYLHGLFAHDAFRADLLRRIGVEASLALRYEDAVEATLDALAAHLERHVNCDRILEFADHYSPASPLTV